MFAEMIRL